MEFNDEIRRYYDSKKRCPRCHKKIESLVEIKIEKKYRSPYKDKINKVICSHCNWKGVIDELLP